MPERVAIQEKCTECNNIFEQSQFLEFCDFMDDDVWTCCIDCFDVNRSKGLSFIGIEQLLKLYNLERK